MDKSKNDGKPGRKMERRIIKEQFLVFLLWMLSRREMHGYEIIKTLKSDKALPCVSLGNIYPTLGELCRKGFIKCRKSMHGRRVRKAYRLSARGSAALRAAKAKIRGSPLMRSFLVEMVE